MIIIRRANGTGTIAKLPGNRRKPYAVKITTGWSDKGTQRYKYISYHKSYREALQALNKYVDDPYSLTDITLADLWEEWYPLQEQKSEGTQKNYRVAWNHLEPLHDMKLRRLDRVTLQRFYDDLNGTTNVAKNVKKVLQPMISYAVKRGILPLTALNLHDIIDLSTAPLIRTVDRKIINSDEISKLWSMSEDETARIILIYLYTGLRFSELYNLEEENIHPDYFDIIKAKTKAGVRMVPLSDKVKTLLPVPYIPPYQTFAAHFHELLPNHTIHDTRHTFITLLTEAGVDPRVIKTIAGHSTKDITEAYTHITLGVMLEAVNKI